MNAHWKEDPRLSGMDARKLEYLNHFAEKVQKTPKNQLMTLFLSLNLDAQKQGIQFNDKETDLLVSILTADMPPAEKKKLSTLKLLASRLSQKGENGQASSVSR